MKISALWTAMLLIFAYVDLFSLYRPDVHTNIESGKVAAFAINQTFLFFVTRSVSGALVPPASPAR